MNVTLIYGPTDRELMLLKRCVHVTMGNTRIPASLPGSALLSRLLNARHSPIRVLNYAFLIEGIPGNTATHFTRHVHAVPFVSSLRNDRQDRIDGDNAPRNTPVDMILYCNAEELMTIANKRLCGKTAELTRQVTEMICREAIRCTPELMEYLVPMCDYHGGVCHEIDSCGRCEHGKCTDKESGRLC